MTNRRFKPRYRLVCTARGWQGQVKYWYHLFWNALRVSGFRMELVSTCDTIIRPDHFGHPEEAARALQSFIWQNARVRYLAMSYAKREAAAAKIPAVDIPPWPRIQ